MTRPRASERCAAILQPVVAMLAAKAEFARRNPQTPALDGVYAAGGAIQGVAQSFGLRRLAEAADSLCALVERFRQGEPSDWSALDAQVAAIRRLSTPGA